jgi:hypothetical protein
MSFCGEYHAQPFFRTPHVPDGPYIIVKPRVSWGELVAVFDVEILVETHPV